jgi:putative spermidine/putrescine transport system permease protein
MTQEAVRTDMALQTLRQDASISFRTRMKRAGWDGTTLLLIPAIALGLILFAYPCVYGVILSFRPKTGGLFASYAQFFSDPFLYQTLFKTLWIALPVTFVNLAIALPSALCVRRTRRQRLLTTILVLPITLGTVLISEGLLNYLGPEGWFNRIFLSLGLISEPMRLVHNYWGVFMSLIITDFPFAFLLTLSYVSGLDPALEKAASTLGAGPVQRFLTIVFPLILPGLAITFCLCFVDAFSVFPSAVLLGAPAGATRVISIAAYEAAFEQFNYSLGSAIAILMGAAQLIVVGAVLAARHFAYSGPMTTGKG